MGTYDVRRGFRSPMIEKERADARSEMEARDLQIEAWKLLALVAAEFSSDPMSTQCFDGRIVARVLAAVEKRAALEKAGIRPAVISDDPS